MRNLRYPRLSWRIEDQGSHGLPIRLAGRAATQIE
jgi:hypothetical protein